MGIWGNRGMFGSALFAAELSVDLPRVDSEYYWIRGNSQPTGWTLQLHAEGPPELKLWPRDSHSSCTLTYKPRSVWVRLYSADKVLPSSTPPPSTSSNSRSLLPSYRRPAPLPYTTSLTHSSARVAARSVKRRQSRRSRVRL